MALCGSSKISFMKLIFGIIFIVLGIGEKRYARTTTTAYVLGNNKVDKCPQNEIEWQEASRRLNCSDDASNPRNRYHCLPVHNLTTLMEFCYKNTRPRVVKGLCMVYVQRLNILDGYNCMEFDDGCPDMFYYSDETYKFQACMNIDPIGRCYVAESSCRPDTTISYGRSTIGRTNKRLIMSLTLFLPYVTLLLLSLIVFAIYILNRRKRKKKKDDKVEHRPATSLSPTSQQKASTSTEDELSKQLEATSLEDSEQLHSETEMLEKVINFFKKNAQTSKKDVRPLEVAKKCVGLNANKSSVNRYLHCLERAEVISLTYLKKTKDSQSDPRWNALPVIKDITEKRIKELATKLNSCSKQGMKSENKTLDQSTVTNKLDVSPGKSQPAASKITGIEETTRSVPTVHAPAYPFSKGTNNQKDVLPSIIRAEVSKSVGLIHIDGQPKGTGFRVGEKYLVTCGHVIQNAIKVKPHIIDGERLRIEFYRITYNQKEDPCLIFGFQPWIAYSDEDHDFVVLELCNDAGVPFPPALTCFADVSVSEIHLVGHPGGRQMKEDSIVPIWLPDHDKLIIPYIDYLANWSKTYFPDKIDHYSVLLQPPRKIMFHTTFDTGSSGSPGVTIRNNRPCVVVMVRGGAPGCFYENIFPDLALKDWQKVEYGYAMADVFRKMLECTQQNIKDLASEIFREWI